MEYALRGEASHCLANERPAGRDALAAPGAKARSVGWDDRTDPRRFSSRL